MNPQQQLAFIKSKCHEANPSKFGGKEMVCKECKREVIKSGAILIREKPCTLSDVLLAIGTQRVRLQPLGGSDASFEMLAESDVFTHEQSWKSTGVSWNFLLPLDGQSEEVWAFLAELLCG